ncbi:MAG: flagellar biosynthesis protein FlhB, partial [Acidobacteriota bacterium]
MAKGEKTEKPTPKKRRDAREKGQAARSKELSASLVFLNTVLLAGFAGSIFVGQLQLMIRSYWKEFLHSDLTLLSVDLIAKRSAFGVMKLAAPLVLLTLIIGFGSSLLQTGFLLSTENLKPKVTGFSPKNNLKKIFSKRGLVELAKALLLMAVIAWIGYNSVRDFLPQLVSLALMDIRGGLTLFANFLFGVSLKVSILLVVVGLADFGFQKYKFEEDLKQSKQEVKEDMKNTEGNPLIKGRIRRLQREMARKRMMASVPEADVVITNPTEYAVALQYDLESMAAPLLLAKGRGLLAQRIKQLAAKHRIPTVENVPLAQALYKSAEVGDEIPANLYKAVAQVLAYVYKLK